MPIGPSLEQCFKPEERKRGEELFRKKTVMISTASDTEVRAFIKASSGGKVGLSAEEVGGGRLIADCSCPVGRKGLLCKHVWAVLLQLEERGSDFLEGKCDAEARANERTPTAGGLKRQQYKAERRQKIKERAKEIRREKKQSAPAQGFSYPPEVEEARGYFSDNGFPLEHPLEMEALMNARKILSRVFHPDKGGTHEESITLSVHFEAIRDYLKS